MIKYTMVHVSIDRTVMIENLHEIYGVVVRPKVVKYQRQYGQIASDEHCGILSLGRRLFSTTLKKQYVGYHHWFCIHSDSLFKS